MKASKSIVAGTMLLLTLVSGCGGSANSREEAAYSFHLGASGFGPFQGAQSEFSKQLKPVVVEGKAADGAALKKQIEYLEKAIAERRERLKHMDPRPDGKTVQPLLTSCEKHLEVQEKIWLNEMKNLSEMIDKGDQGALLKLSIMGAMKTCQGAEIAAMKDLKEKFEAFEQEFGPELKKKGRI